MSVLYQLLVLAFVISQLNRGQQQTVLAEPVLVFPTVRCDWICIEETLFQKTLQAKKMQKKQRARLAHELSKAVDFFETTRAKARR